MDMATDIVPELNEAIQSTFQTRMVSDKRIMRISRRIRDGTATLVDAHRYSQYTGENLSKALLQNLRADTLPGGTLYYNIANRTVTPALRNNYNLVNEISKQVQAIADKVTEIGITAVAADFPEERIKGLIDKMTSYDNLEESLAWLKEPIVNNTEAFLMIMFRAMQLFGEMWDWRQSSQGRQSRTVANGAQISRASGTTEKNPKRYTSVMSSVDVM